MTSANGIIRRNFDSGEDDLPRGRNEKAFEGKRSIRLVAVHRQPMGRERVRQRALDATFGSAGKDQLSLAVPSSTDYRANDVAVQPDGKIVLAGTASNSSSDAWSIARLNVEGSLDC